MSEEESWLCREEWEDVYSWLYSSDPVLVRKGVGRVAAWKARGPMPMVVEVTADLCECRLCDRGKDKSVFQVLHLQYAMAISRFVNAIGDLAKVSMNASANLVACVNMYDVPSWMVTLRHCGTHEKLPSLGALRAGAEFALSWLRANYWRPQRLTIGEQQGARDVTPPEGEGGQGEHSRKGKDANSREGHIWRLTKGLCQSRDQLATLLVHADYEKLSDYLKKEQLLQFPSSVKYTVTIPDLNELDSLSSLCVGEGDMAVWRTHLLRAARSSCSVRQRLVSALICAANDEECPASLRHFLCGWLSFLWKSDWPSERRCATGESSPRTETADALERETTAEARVIDVVGEANGCYLPGGLDWKELLLVAKQHPGYYLCAIIKEIVQHLQPSLSKSAVGNLMHLSALATLSSRIGHLDSHTSPPHHHHHHSATRSEELEKLWTLWNRKLGSQSRGGVAEEPKGGVETGEGEGRWRAVEDMSVWVVCPIGVCPQQQVASDMLEIPLLHARQGNGNGRHDVEHPALYEGATSDIMISGGERPQPAEGTATMAANIAGSALVTEQHSCDFTFSPQQVKGLRQCTKIL